MLSAIQSKGQFVLADAMAKIHGDRFCQDVFDAAQKVVIPYKGNNDCTAEEVVHDIEKSVLYSQIYEVWEANRQSKIRAFAKNLPTLEREALLIAGGCAVTDEAINMVMQSADDAFQSAYEAMYGDGDDEYDY